MAVPSFISGQEAPNGTQIPPNAPQQETLRNIVLFVLSLGMVIAVMYHAVQSRILHPPDVMPWSSFLIGAEQRFDDFFGILHLPVYCIAGWATPPLTLITGLALAPLAEWDKTTALLLFTVGSVALLLGGFVALAGYGRKKVFFDYIFAFMAICLSYPIIFCVDRGNQATFVVAFCSWGILFFIRERFHLAAAAFGIAVSLKFTPIVFGALFLSRRATWRYIGTMVGCAGVLTGLSVLALQALDTPYSWPMFQLGARTYLGEYVLRDGGLLYNSSLFAALKDVMYLVTEAPGLAQQLLGYMGYYNIFIFLVSLPMVFCTIHPRTRLVDRIAILFCWQLLIPMVMAD